MIGKIKKDSRRRQFELSDEHKTFKKKKSNNDPNNSTEKIILVNRIYKTLELIGIYEKYKSLNEKNDFPKYYNNCTAIPKYWCRNRGLDIIYDLLKSEGMIDNLDYIFSKGSMRKTGIYICSRRAYEGTEIFVERMIKYLKDDDYLWNFYINNESIHSNNIHVYLDFQDDLITENNLIRFDHIINYFCDMRAYIGGSINV